MVAKANCYGLGSKLCRHFNNHVDYFAVSSAGEFLNLQRYVSKPILILDPIYENKTLLKLIGCGAELTISNKESLDILLKLDVLNQKIKVHLAVNTGMNRFGFKNLSDFKKAIKKIKKSQNIKLIGVFSHYFDGKNTKIAKNQQKIFNLFCSIAEKIYKKPFIKHIAASDGSVFNNYGDMVRVGYGLYDDTNFETITLKSKILDFQILNKNDRAGYGGIFVANKKTKIAIVGIGYGDGLMRNIVKKGYVLIGGKFAKIVAVCMDAILVDVTKISCKINDDVIIIGKSGKNKISICDIANFCDTIGYEIIVRLSNRINRVYLGEDKCKLLQGNIEQENSLALILTQQDQLLQE